MPYNEIQCKNADEFWDLLDPRNPLRLNLPIEESQKLIYRGQANSEWSLVPSSLRKFNNDKISNKYAEEIVEIEFNNIKDFILHLSFKQSINQILPTIDVDTLFDNDYFNNQFKDCLSNWPNKEYYPLVALAQHHNIETRLLDWSKYSYIAAYFASTPHLWNDDKNVDFIAVWVYMPNNSSRISIKELPLSSDKNMNSQLGCFTLVEQKMEIGSLFIIETIDDVSSEEYLWKIKVHKNQVPSILQICSLHQIHAGSIYSSRGLYSVSEACKEKNRWNEMMGNIKELSIFSDTNQPIEDQV